MSCHAMSCPVMFHVISFDSIPFHGSGVFFSLLGLVFFARAGPLIGWLVGWLVGWFWGRLLALIGRQLGVAGGWFKVGGSWLA